MAAVVCYRKCWGCIYDQHLSEWHTWADSEDALGAVLLGLPDPSDQRCGCYCCADAEYPTPPAATEASTSVEGDGEVSDG